MLKYSILKCHLPPSDSITKKQNIFYQIKVIYIFKLYLLVTETIITYNVKIVLNHKHNDVVLGFIMCLNLKFRSVFSS